MRLARSSLACLAYLVVLARGLVACGSTSADNADAGGGDATADTGGGVDQSAGRDTGIDSGIDSGAIANGDSGHDGPVDTGIDAGSGGNGDSGDDAIADSGDAATVFGCEGGPSLPPDAGLPPVHLCSYGDGSANFPLFDKCCGSSTDCAFGFYEYSCCGDRLALGYNKSQGSAFQAALAGWTCAACGCAGQGLHTEDGEGGVAEAGVKCENGWCVTYAK